ncbi:MAG TPA: DUF4837 family protein [Candidatus Coprenecus stercoravium]|uniref:DUF4837 family protein n=1 Tax=Candidatus Coprenecus stercoravium TaxID=2840735 RepID=A0A9D2K921_9BACT|nr:DUF4837 family protein [Candidatus Coprenecus stercoravium]
MRMNIFSKITTLLLTAAMILTSCGNNTGKDRSKYLPSITGNAGEVLVVINKGYWEGELGSRLREILTSEYPYLPQREPVFKLLNATPGGFSGSYLLHRNIIIVNVSPEIDTTGVKITTDAWAKPQIIVTVSATTPEEATDLVTHNDELIINAIEQYERNRIIANSTKYEDREVRMAVTENIGGSPYFPKGFTMKKNTPDFMWISQETTHVNQGILIFKFPYTESSQLTPEYLKDKLYDLWQANVPGMRDNSYMTFNKVIEPGFNTISYQGESMIEMRGLWEVENDYMGGPFVCHIFPDRERKNIIILNAFVYAPKYDKRKYLRQVESIIYSFKWQENLEVEK